QNFTNQSFTKLESYCNENISPENKAIITRTNAGIIEFINEIENETEYTLLKEPDKIFAPLYAIIHFKNAKFDLIPQEYSYFKNFSTTKELYEYINKCQDKELLSALNLLNKGFNIYEISKKAKRLFYNKKAKNFIINAHQAKGLEWDSVEIYNDFSSLKDLQEDLRKETDKKKKQELYLSLEQERNLFYVAITRARSLLMDTSKNRIFYSNQND
ncbi:3'-5' exonuclease, partial [Helicobacter rodentium]